MIIIALLTTTIAMAQQPRAIFKSIYEGDKDRANELIDKITGSRNYSTPEVTLLARALMYCMFESDNHFKIESGYSLYVENYAKILKNIEEIEKIIEKVKETGLVYMMGETCYYYPCAMYCREQYEKGNFGKFVYGESQYYHDMECFSYAFAHSGGPNWKRVAGIPPMYYSTHSMSMAFSAIDDYPIEVTAFGYKDIAGDGIFGKEKEAAILKAEADKQAAILKADGEAQAILAVQKALADSLALLNEKAPTDQVLKLKSIEAMQKVADGKATKIIIPSEMQGLVGLANGLVEGTKE